MSKRSNAGYYAQLEHVYSHCQDCGITGARFAKSDERTLCKQCRARYKCTCPALPEPPSDSCEFHAKAEGSES